MARNDRGWVSLIYPFAEYEFGVMDTMPKISIICTFAALLILVGCGAGSIAVGGGDDDWWITYPRMNPLSGNEVPHASWALDALQSKPVFIFLQKEQCPACALQRRILDGLLDGYLGDIAYFDIDALRDRRAFDMIAYDPDGGVGTIPLIVILTWVVDSQGQVQVGWHSTEEVVGDDRLRSYLDDALAQFRQNSG